MQDLRPKGHDVLREELGSMVDKEMLATSTAIEEAVLRMDVSTDVRLVIEYKTLRQCCPMIRVYFSEIS